MNGVLCDLITGRNQQGDRNPGEERLDLLRRGREVGVSRPQPPLLVC